MKKTSLTEKLIENPKSLIAIALVIVIVVLLLYFVLRSTLKNVQNAGQKIADNAKINEYMTTSGEKLSYGDLEYEKMADTLERAMAGCGTDEEAIYSVMSRMNNNTDVLKLSAAFGTRQDETLSQWLGGDLSSSEMAKVNAILKNKGITITF